MILYPEIYYVLPCFESTNDYEGSFCLAKREILPRLKSFIFLFCTFQTSLRLNSRLTSDQIGTQNLSSIPKSRLILAIKNA